MAKPLSSITSSGGRPAASDGLGSALPFRQPQASSIIVQKGRAAPSPVSIAEPLVAAPPSSPPPSALSISEPDGTYNQITLSGGRISDVANVGSPVPLGTSGQTAHINSGATGFVTDSALLNDGVDLVASGKVTAAGVIQGGGYNAADASPGISATVALAQLTTGGAAGSATFKNGLLTAYIAPT